MALIVGEHFAGYEILAELGRGGMGAVYQARQTVLQRIVALKVLPPQLATDRDFITRFQSEAIAAGSLHHPNIVLVYTAGECSGIEFIAMEFVEGETIQHRIRRCGRLPLTEALDVAYHVATALEHAWQTAQLIHRDVKPDNIFLAQNGTVKLGDFGLAKILRDGAASQTVTGHIMGSPHYISPEQARGQRDLDWRADVYSLGCTLHYMMTGRTVFEGADFMGILYKHVNEAPEPIQTLLPHCPGAVQRLLTRMLQKDRARRHQSYGELIDEIIATRNEAAVWEASDERRRRRMAGEPSSASSRGAYAVAALMTVLVAIGLGYARRTQHAPAPNHVVTLADPSDRRDFITALQELSPPERVQRVFAKMRELNPGFTGNERYTVEGNVVTDLMFSSVAVKNLWPLCALKNLRVLHCPADGANRRRSELEDLSPLAELPDLEEIDCSWTSVQDLSPLAKLPVNTLRCANSRVETLAPLSRLSLYELDLSGTAVSDLGPLRGMPLAILNLEGTRVRDLTPLHGAPLRHVRADIRLLRAQPEIVRSWTKLETINGSTPRDLIPRRTK